MNLPPLPKPDAHMWQHGETGNTGFLQDAPQEELDQWERINRPRKIVAPMFSEAKLRQAQREAVAAAVPGWIPVTQDLVNEQHDWLYKPFWIAFASGLVGTGYYEWRQGRDPDRFYLDGGGDIHISEATHIMPIKRPSPPKAQP